MTATERAAEVSEYLHDLFLIPPACDEQVVNAIAGAIIDAELAAVAAFREWAARECESIAFAHRHAGDVGPDMLCIKAAARIREARP